MEIIIEKHTSISTLKEGDLIEVCNKSIHSCAKIDFWQISNNFDKATINMFNNTVGIFRIKKLKK